MRMGNRILTIFVLLFLLAASFGPVCSYGQQVFEQKEAGSDQTKEEPEKIIGSPQNIKEKIAIFVFVVWMWLSVIVLVSFLRLKIKEVDRLYRFRFFSDDKK